MLAVLNGGEEEPRGHRSLDEAETLFAGRTGLFSMTGGWEGPSRLGFIEEYGEGTAERAAKLNHAAGYMTVVSARGSGTPARFR